MNAASPLAVNAAVCHKLHAALDFPGDTSSWQAHQSTSSSTLNAHHEELGRAARPARPETYHLRLERLRVGEVLAAHRRVAWH